MNKLDILKGGTELIVSIGVSSIVGNAIKMTTDPSAGKIKKAAIGVGGFVLSRMIGEMATDYTNKRIDDTATRIKKIIHPENDIEIDITDNVHVIIESDSNEEASK